MTHRTRSLAVLALSVAALCLPAAPGRADTAAAPATGPVLQALGTGEGAAVAKVLGYPASYSPAERAKDTTDLGNAVALMFRQFGRVVSATPTDGSVPFYQVWLCTGPKRLWWENEGAETRDHYFTVTFEKYGPGFLQLSTALKDGVETPVGVGFGLPMDVAGRERGNRALQSLYDLMGVPKDHPGRKQALPISQMPAAPQR